MRVAFVFPGQGSQHVGMGRALYDEFPAVRRLFRDADAVLNMNMAALCFEGPERTLTETENAQPAVTLVSMACLTVLRDAGVECIAAAGHSLGEYAALYAAGVVPFEYALKTVRLRGELMRDAARENPGGMLAVIGLDPAEYDDVCAAAAGTGSVEVANVNSPRQVILAGEIGALERAATLAKERGAAYTTFLKVSGPWHSRFMAEAGAGLARHLELSCLRRPRVPVVSNVTGDFYSNVAEMRAGLVAQVTSAVRWIDCVRSLTAVGIDLIVELGPGKLLAGLIRDIDASVPVVSVESADGLGRLQEKLARGGS